MFCNSLNRVVFLDLCFQIRMPTLLLCDKLSQNVDFLRVAVAVLRDPWKSTVGTWGEQNSTLSPLYPPLLSPHAWVTLVLSHFSLCDPTGCSPPGSSVHGISQTRVLEWVAIPPSGGLPDPGIKPMSPALAGGFFTTGSPGKPSCSLLYPPQQSDLLFLFCISVLFMTSLLTNGFMLSKQVFFKPLA